MSDASSFQKRTFEQTRNDPLYMAWAEAEERYIRSVKRYSAAYKEELEKAKEVIRQHLQPIFGPELKLTSDSVYQSMEAYASVYQEHPPTNLERFK
jgi:hypothetical protein